MRSGLVACLVALGCGGGAAAPADSGAPVGEGACPLEGWCWVNPLPQGNELSSVWSDGADDVWAVGGAGTIVHWDGERWSLTDSGVSAYLLAVWGSSAHDVWAAGEGGLLLHWDGASWTETPSGTTVVTFTSLWGSGPDDVWAVGYTDLTRLPMAEPGSIAPPLGAALHWDGRSWSLASLPTTVGPSDIWGTGPTEVWVASTDVDGSWVLHRWDGQVWSEAARLEHVDGFLSGIWASGPDDIRLYGDRGAFHFDGTSWSTEDFGSIGSVSRMRGARRDDVWALGNALGAKFVNVAHFDGSKWDLSSNNVPSSQFVGLWAGGGSDPWLVGYNGHMWRWDGRAWRQVSEDMIAGTSEQAPGLTAVWGSSAQDVWAVGMSGDIFHWDGRAWTRSPSGTEIDLLGVWGSGPDDVWAFGSMMHRQTILHWDGHAWTISREDDTTMSRVTVHSIWGSGPDDVWAVGHPRYNGPRVIYHWDGSAWSIDSSGDERLEFVWGSGPRDVWAVGNDGGMLHWDGQAWSTVATGTTSGLGPIWGSAADDVWLSGSSYDAEGVRHGELRHWNGTAWTLVDSPGGEPLYGFWGSRSDDVWAVSVSDYVESILRWDGSAWTRVPRGASALSPWIGALWGSGAGDIWAVGGSSILYHAPSSAK